MSENGNGNGTPLLALQKAARQAVYRDLKFADFDPALQGSVKVRVSLTHAENREIARLSEELRAKSEHLRDLPVDEEHTAEREALLKELSDLRDAYLVLIGSLLGMTKDETLQFFRDEDEEQNPVFEQWVMNAVSALVRDWRESDFLAQKARSAVGAIR